MKKQLLLFVICFVWISSLTEFSIAQDTNENLLDEIVVNFSLTGEPTSEQVGFDNRKSYWQLEYELVLLDSSTLEKIGRCQRTPDYKLLCPLQTSPKTDKNIKKLSTRIIKGKFKEKQLLDQSNRDVKIPIKLSNQVIDVFNQARTSNSNPTFVLFVKTKVSTKTSDKIKFKKKTSTNKVYPLKSFLPDKSFGTYWNVKNFGLTFNIKRSKNLIIGFDILRN